MSENLVYEKIGALIKQYRRDLKMTQRDLAARVGMSRGSVANIENGFQRLYPHQLYVFSKHLSSEDRKISPRDLLPDIKEDQLEELRNLKIEIRGGKGKPASSKVDDRTLMAINDVREKAFQTRNKNDTSETSTGSSKKAED